MESLTSAYEVAFRTLQWPLLMSPPPKARHRLALLLGLRWHATKVAGVHGAFKVRLRNSGGFLDALRVVAHTDGERSALRIGRRNPRLRTPNPGRPLLCVARTLARHECNVGDVSA
jgi:hypothetical protein